jgi:hypothetical protein
MKLKVSLAVVLSLALLVSGCSTSWVQVAINDAPVVLQIVLSILQIADVAAVPAAQQAGTQAQADLALLQKYLNDYKSAVANSPEQVAALKDIGAALTAANGDISGILSAVHVKDPSKQAAISAGLGVALSVLLSIESLLPQSPVTPTVKAKVAASLPGPSEVKKRYNSAVAAAYPGAKI